MKYIIQHDFARYLPQNPKWQIVDNLAWASKPVEANSPQEAKQMINIDRLPGDQLNPFYLIAVPFEMFKAPITSNFHDYRKLQY